MLVISNDKITKRMNQLELRVEIYFLPKDDFNTDFLKLSCFYITSRSSTLSHPLLPSLSFISVQPDILSPNQTFVPS